MKVRDSRRSRLALFLLLAGAAFRSDPVAAVEKVKLSLRAAPAVALLREFIAHLAAGRDRDFAAGMAMRRLWAGLSRCIVGTELVV